MEDDDTSVMLQKVGCLSGDDTSATDCLQLTEDLSSMAEHKLIDSALQLRLQEQQKFVYRKLPSSIVPLYQCIDKPEGDKGESKLNASTSKVCKAKFNPLVEVVTGSNKSILIRKTTALWLLQEGEQISSD